MNAVVQPTGSRPDLAWASQKLRGFEKFMADALAVKASEKEYRAKYLGENK